MPASVWADTAAALDPLGHRAVPLELPGVDDASTLASLDDQLAAALAVIDSTAQPLVVGHSAASTLAWLVADRRPDSIAGAVMIGGMPSASGSSYAAFFAIGDGMMGFPGWDPFDGPDAADLRAEARRIAREVADTTAPVSVALTRQMLWRMLGAAHPMEAHRVDSRGIMSRGNSADAREGVESFLEKRDPVYPGRISDGLPDIFPDYQQPTFH